MDLLLISGLPPHLRAMGRLRLNRVVPPGHLMVHMHAAEVMAWITQVLDEAEDEARLGV